MINMLEVIYCSLRQSTKSSVIVSADYATTQQKITTIKWRKKWSNFDSQKRFY